jgi:nitrate/nitrite-specific signal transduction histidine kinase
MFGDALIRRLKKIARALIVRGSLRETLIIAFLLVALPALVGISAATIWRQYQNIRELTIAQLTSVAILKERQVTTWFNALAPDLELVVADPRVRSDITQLIATQHNEIVANAWRAILVDTFTVARVAGHKFTEICLMDQHGTVIVSTNPNRAGQVFDTRLFFQEGLRASHVQKPSSDPAFGTVIFAAVPVRDDKQVARGVLVGVANLDTLNEIMQERPGLGRTGETYLVGADGVMLTAPRDPTIPKPVAVATQGARAALNRMNGSGLYASYQTPPIPVVGVYRWMPTLEIALLAEQSQAEAFEETSVGIWTLIGTTVGVAALTITAAYAIARSIAIPLEDLTVLATRVAGGDLTQTIRVARADEIGVLANALNTMTVQLRELFANLEQRVAARTAQLEQELIERARAEDALQKARTVLAALYQVTATASQAIDLTTLLTQSLAQIIRAVQSDGGIVFLVEDNQNDSSTPLLQLVAHQGISARAVEQMTLFAARHGTARWITRHREPLVIPNLAIAPQLPDAMRQLGQVSIVLTPMRAEGQVLGILGLTRASASPYRDEEITLLASLADQVGIAVQSDHLRERAHHATILEERQRLARELHDSVTQMMYSVLLFAEATRDSIHISNQTQSELYINRLHETAQQALREMRLLIYESQPQPVTQDGLVEALHRRLQMVENHSGIGTQLLADDTLDLPVAVQIEMYGIAQEALNNVLKHSAATQVTVQVHVTDAVQLEIRDNGKGFARDTLNENTGVGLASMRERAGRLGGTLAIDSRPGEGTRVQLRIPLATDRINRSRVEEDL